MNNNFKDIENINICQSCEHDIFTLLLNDKDKDKLLAEYINHHPNKELYNIIENKTLNIQYILSVFCDLFQVRFFAYFCT